MSAKFYLTHENFINLPPEVYCAAFTKAFLSYTWTQSSASKVDTLPVTELRYHVIVEGVLTKGVIPYIKQQFDIG